MIFLFSFELVSINNAPYSYNIKQKTHQLPHKAQYGRITEVIVCERQSHVELRIAVLSYTALPVFYPSQVILVVREIKVRQLTSPTSACITSLLWSRFASNSSLWDSGARAKNEARKKGGGLGREAQAGQTHTLWKPVHMISHALNQLKRISCFILSPLKGCRVQLRMEILSNHTRPRHRVEPHETIRQVIKLEGSWTNRNQGDWCGISI